MKRFVVLLLIITACNNPKKESTGTTSKDTVTTVSDQEHYDEDDSNTGDEMERLYVINEKGAHVYTKDAKSASWSYPFGSYLTVVKEKGNLLGISHKGSDSIAYVNKSDLGTELQIPLSPAYLNMTFNETQSLLKDISLRESTPTYNANDYPDVEVSVISRQKFSQLKAAAPTLFFKNDAVKKVNNTIIIGKKQFKDTKNGTYENSYDYVGEYKSLNAYVLEYTCTECEEYSYEVVDKTTGQVKGSFSYFPYYQANGNIVASLGQLHSNSPTILNIFEIPDTMAYVDKYFGSWIPVGDMFWGADGNLYTEAIPYVTASQYYSDKQKRDSEKYNFRYLKIKIKGASPRTDE